MSDVELEVPEDMEIRMVVELQNLGKFLLITIPTKLKDLSVPLSMAVVACMFASHAPCNMFYGCRSCLATCLEEDAIPAVGEEPKEPLIAGDFSGQSVGEEEVRLSNYNGCSALRGSVSGHPEQCLISKDCQLLDPQPAVEVRALQGSKAVTAELDIILDAFNAETKGLVFQTASAQRLVLLKLMKLWSALRRHASSHACPLA